MSLNKRLMSSQPAPFVASENFKVVTWTGNGSARSITGVGFKPDFVWIKDRSAANWHYLFDSTRGGNKPIFSNANNAESVNDNNGYLSSFDADGFSITSGSLGMVSLNANNNTYVAWCWKANGGTTSSNSDGSQTTTVQANTDAGFSIITGTMGSSGSSTFGHGLGVAPKMIIHKDIANANAWMVYHESLGAGKEVRLNETNAATSSTTPWGNTAPTTTVYTGGNGYIANAGANFVAYCFAEVENFSSFGSYTGNGSANGPIVETGFEPAFIMFKRTDGTAAWNITDNKRNLTNPRTSVLQGNATDQEYTDSSYAIDFLSNGFKIQTSDNGWNTSGSPYIYMAFAADPDTEAPTLASSFNIETWTGDATDNRTITGLGFQPNMVWYKTRTAANDHNLSDSIRGAAKQVRPNRNIAEQSATDLIKSFDTDGFTLGTGGDANASGADYVAWSWKADDNEPTIEEVTEDADAVAIYELNQNANDALGNYNGTVTGTANWTSSGKFNYAAQFDSWHINTGHNFSLANNSFSISFWFANSATGSTNSYVISTDGPETQNNHLLIGRRDSNGKLNFAFYANDLNSATDVTTDGTWQHWVCTYNASTNSRKIYLNGSLDASDTASADYQGTGNLEIGFGIYQGLGKVDQVRVYNKELNAKSVTNLYNETAAQNNTVNIGTKQTNSIEAIVSANANAGFSIAKGSGAGKITIPHGLSAAPNLVIKKGFSITEDWYVYHSAVGTGKYLSFNRNNGTDAPTTRADSFSSVTATSVTDDVTSADVEYIMYSFHDVAGYQKIGSYTGDGNNDRAVTTGFKPDFVMIKSTVGSDNWRMYDTRRGITGGGYLEPNRSDADDTSNAPNLTMTSTGFTITSGGVTAGNNANGNLYIYWAVAKNVPSNTTLANSFKAVTYSGNGGTQSITGTGFKPDLVWIKHRNEANDHVLTDSIRGRGLLYSNGNDAQNQDSQLTSFDSDGFSLAYNTGQNVKFNKSGGTYVAWAWKAGNTWQSNLDGTIASTINANTANGFSIAKWTGNGSAATVGHGLSSAPEMVITKRLSGASDWYTYHKDLNSGTNPAYNFIKLNSSDAEIVNASSGGSIWNSTSPSSTVINIGTSLSGSSDEYVAYCFHSVSGYSKIGSYTGTGATGNTVTVGFQPDFVMVKATGEAEPWFILDSARDTSNPRDNRLMPDSNAAEDDGSVHTMDFNSDNFTLNGTVGNGTNGSSKTYIYMAFKMN